VTCEIEREITATIPEADDESTLRLVIPDDQDEVWIHRRSRSEMLTAYYSDAQAISWKGHDGEEVYGLYFQPTNPNFESSGAPPLIVKVHGGPTSQVDAHFSPEAQFYTSRGFAFLEVNHRGSTGYGKVYRDKLLGAWGTYDVEDSASGAQYLVDKGLADGRRLVILGGSAAVTPCCNRWWTCRASGAPGSASTGFPTSSRWRSTLTGNSRRITSI